jgi:hypothetical protein
VRMLRTFLCRTEHFRHDHPGPTLDLLHSLKMDAKRWLNPHLKRIPELPW